MAPRAGSTSRASSPRWQHSSRVCLVVTAEHASNAVPANLRHALNIPPSILKSHRGWDPGTLELARKIARTQRSPLFTGSWSRLVFDLNRSPENPEVFSDWTRKNLSQAQRQRLLGMHQKFWSTTGQTIRKFLRQPDTMILHLSVHSFTPVLRGSRRTTGIGILFDPERPCEKRFAGEFMRILRKTAPTYGCQRLVIDANKPYLGTADAHTTALRSLFRPDNYCGIEIEVNQRLVSQSSNRARWNEVQNWISAGIAELIGE